MCDELAHFHTGIVAEAHYHLRDMRRQRGDLTQAELAFESARELGREPQPGLALLRLAQGRNAAALAAIRGVLSAEIADPLARAQLLRAAAEIMLAIGEIDDARDASEELGRVAKQYGTAGLLAQSARASGAVLLASGEMAQAATEFRRSLHPW